LLNVVVGRRVSVVFPIVDEALDVTALGIREREPLHDPSHFCWIVLGDGGLEPLAKRFGLS
jgi:hypothetical protein